MVIIIIIPYLLTHIVKNVELIGKYDKLLKKKTSTNRNKINKYKRCINGFHRPMEIKVNQLRIKINTDRNKVYDNSFDRIWN